MSQRKDLRILIVDDNRAFRESFQATLARIGYSARTAENGAEALDLLAQQQADLVFSDLKMPGITGWDLVGRIKKLYPATHVVVVTSCQEAGEGAGGGPFGAQVSGVLSKPIKRHDIQEILERLCPTSDGGAPHRAG